MSIHHLKNELLILGQFHIYSIIANRIEFPQIPHLISPTIYSLCQHCIFVVIKEAVLIHYYVLKSILYSVSFIFTKCPFLSKDPIQVPILHLDVMPPGCESFRFSFFFITLIVLWIVRYFVGCTSTGICAMFFSLDWGNVFLGEIPTRQIAFLIISLQEHTSLGHLGGSVG